MSILAILIGLSLVVALGAAMQAFVRPAVDRIQPPRTLPDASPAYDSLAYLRRRKQRRMDLQAEIDRL